VWKTLFTGTGNDGQWKNDAGLWYSSGSTVTSGHGKRSAYDDDKLTGLRFSHTGGGTRTFVLKPSYSGKTLLQIVNECMGSASQNTPSAAWRNGHCKIAEGFEAGLRIGVGDGSADYPDWALFTTIAGNGAMDMLGSNMWNFGGEQVSTKLFRSKVRC
jgi:hypothetical protein